MRQSRSRFLTFFLISLITLLIRGSSSTVLGTAEIAQVNSIQITLEDFNQKYQDTIRLFQIKPPTKEGVLEELIQRELGVQEARRIGIDKDPVVVDRVKTVIYHALLEKTLSKEFDKIHVSDDVAKGYYQKNPEIRTSQIFVALQPQATEEEVSTAFKRINTIYKNYIAESGTEFSEAARRFSEGSAALMGGDIGFQTRDKLDPRYYEAAIKLASLGKVSEVIRTRFGFHVVKLTGIRSWEEVDQAKIKRLVFEEQRAKIFDSYIATLRSRAHVAIRTELLKN